MSAASREILNQFFVKTFNQISAAEERAMLAAGITNLSIRELHVIEAAVLCGEEESTMSRMAAVLGISVGALTTAVNALVRKGYVVRRGRPEDRRVVLVVPTETGRAANELHASFHEQMIGAVLQELPEEQVDTLTQALETLTRFFKNYAKR